MKVTTPLRSRTPRARSAARYGIGAAAALIAAVAAVAWWAYPVVFPVRVTDLRPGDTYAMLSGLTFTTPEATWGQATRERRGRVDEYGLAEIVNFRNAAGDLDGASLFSHGADPMVDAAFRGVQGTFRLAARTPDGTVEVRWRDSSRDSSGDRWSSLAVVTRLPGHNPGLITAFGVPHIGNSRRALQAAAELWRDLRIDGARLPRSAQ